MYTNFIFDMGNVLMDFSPDYILSRFTTDPVEIEALKEIIFKSSYWKNLDNGDISFKDALAEVIQLTPAEYHQTCETFFNEWHLHKVPRLDMLEIIKNLKAKGYGIYLCSNAASRFHTYKDKYEVFEYFDDLLISADIRISKPDPRIYEHLLKSNHLDPKTCLFIDDLSVNIDSAKTCGIAGYHYNGNATLFRSFLEILSIL